MSSVGSSARVSYKTPSVGYEIAFLGRDLEIALPTVVPSLEANLVHLDGSPSIPYTRFSLSMSRSRRLARWVAWNIDGANFEFADSISRDGVDCRPDPRLPLDVQTLEDVVYATNSLDRGHLARRADLLGARSPRPARPTRTRSTSTTSPSARHLQPDQGSRSVG
ncbi:DNA/RNA non-specific endonuclease [Nocardioides scoriae]|uniref:DNA/RNA non-specific endonuclease n=1 Tax=Nocardioides scoriae TaxID=642780 RepID=UPI0012FA181D|nr:DNA/RNA non-specific endonuclease [Nocardioides scoriae]